MYLVNMCQAITIGRLRTVVFMLELFHAVLYVSKIGTDAEHMTIYARVPEQ